MAKVLTNKKGFGMEDAPFMILMTILVLMLVVWIGVTTITAFIHGNDYQSAVNSATDIYKRAKLLTLGYEGSSDQLMITLPDSYALSINDSIYVLTDLVFVNDSLSNSTQLISPLSLKGARMVSENPTLTPGTYNLTLVYSRENEAVVISWE
jgi:hypothetical protein